MSVDPNKLSGIWKQKVHQCVKIIVATTKYKQGQLNYFTLSAFNKINYLCNQTSVKHFLHYHP